MFTNLAKNIYRKRLIIEGKYQVDIDSLDFIYNFLIAISHQIKNDRSKEIGMRGPFVYDYRYGEPVTNKSSFEGHMVWNEHEIGLYTWHKEKFFSIDIYTCSEFDIDEMARFVEDYFKCDNQYTWHELPQPSPFPDNESVEIKETKNGYEGLFAVNDIKEGEFITYIDGQVLYAEKESDLESLRNSTADYAVQFNKNHYRNSFNSNAVKINHSCEPNCFIQDSFIIKAMRDIPSGEELTISYSLMENSDWRGHSYRCLCGSANCYGNIVSWRDLSKEDKIKYLPYTADWILLEEMKNSGGLELLKDKFEKIEE